jgi:Sec-independent protein translocase protein TatA
MLEIALIVVVVVMLFPPSELPKLARGVARFYGMIRRTADDFRSAILHDEDLREPFEEIKGAYDGARWELQRAREEARREMAKARMDARIAARKKNREKAELAEGDEQKELGPRPVPRREAGAAVRPVEDLPEQAEAKPGAEPAVAVSEAKASEPRKPLFSPPPAVGSKSDDEEGAA